MYRGGPATAQMIYEGNYSGATLTAGLTFLSALGGYQSARSLRGDIAGVREAFGRGGNHNSTTNSVEGFMEKAREIQARQKALYPERDFGGNGYGEYRGNFMDGSDDISSVTRQRGYPLGFEKCDEFVEFGSDLNNDLRKAGADESSCQIVMVKT